MKKILSILSALIIVSGCSTSLPKEKPHIDVSLEIICGYQLLTLEKSPDYIKAKEINNQTVAYIEIEGVINEPIVQTTNNDFYVRHDIHRKYSSSGTVFLDYETPYLKHFNTIIYGHTSLLVEESKFSNLNQYKDREFYENNKTIEIMSDSGADTFEIIGVSIWEDNKIQNEAPHFMMYDMLPHEGRAWIDDISKSELYPITRNNIQSKKVITLVTCDEENITKKLIIYAAKKG